MPFFRKKPVVIEAVQYHGPGDAYVLGEFTRTPGTLWWDAANVLRVRTLEGEHIASPGDWIIRGVKGEFYPCKPDVFEKTYELAALRAESPPEVDCGCGRGAGCGGMTCEGMPQQTCAASAPGVPLPTKGDDAGGDALDREDDVLSFVRREREKWSSGPASMFGSLSARQMVELLDHLESLAVRPATPTPTTPPLCPTCVEHGNCAWEAESHGHATQCVYFAAAPSPEAKPPAPTSPPHADWCKALDFGTEVACDCGKRPEFSRGAEAKPPAPEPTLRLETYEELAERANRAAAEAKPPATTRGPATIAEFLGDDYRRDGAPAPADPATSEEDRDA